MINLIPIEEKRKNRRNFYLRILTVFLLMLSLAFLVADISVLPANIFSSLKKNLANIRLENIKKEPLPVVDEQTSNVINDLDNKLNLIDKIEKEKFLVSKNVFDKILAEKTPDVKITNIFYETDPANQKSIIVSGIATNREALLSFQNVLKADPIFSKVDLPISNFIKDSNIEFNLNLTE